MKGADLTFRHIAASAAVILSVGQLLFAIGIATPDTPYFDETHYVPAARALLRHVTTVNSEHPPLGKEIMAVGIALFGDGPFGWRYPSAVFGALALVGIYLWALALFRDAAPARWAVAVTAVDQVLYVQARIGMLDIFAATFMIWSLAGFAALWHPMPPARQRLVLAATGACLGLAAACKWIGLIVWADIVGTALLVGLLRLWRTRFDRASPDDWYRPDLWAGLRLSDWLIGLGGAPLFFYWLTYLPLGVAAALPGAFIQAQVAIWTQNASLGGTHTYASTWPGWPIIARPIWYLFEGTDWDTPRASAAAVLYMGNPAVLWLGIVGIAACAVGWIRRRHAAAFVILAAYLSLYLGWAVIPRHLTFAYYYFPATLVLGPALAYLFYRTRLRRLPLLRAACLALAIGSFGYFLPISDAAIRVSEAGFNQRMWFESWR